MGYMVPLPPVCLMRVELRDGEIVTLTPWRCSYCNTAQRTENMACGNCGAPRPGTDEAAQRVTGGENGISR